MRDTGGEFKDFILDQLTELNGIRCKAMFGGHGLYQDEFFFGIIHKSRVYFKVNDETRKEYEKSGMKYFQPSLKQSLKNYYEVPADVIEDANQLLAWAEQAAGKGSMAADALKRNSK